MIDDAERRRLELTYGVDPTTDAWMVDGKCYRRSDWQQLFFPERGQSQKKAKRLCGECSVQELCDAYAELTNQKYGIWGGKIRHRDSNRYDHEEDYYFYDPEAFVSEFYQGF